LSALTQRSPPTRFDAMSLLFLQLGHGAQRPDWLAGHMRLEPRNPSASYLIGVARQLGLRQAHARRRRPFACELRDTDLQLRPRFQQTILARNSGQSVGGPSVEANCRGQVARSSPAAPPSRTILIPGLCNVIPPRQYCRGTKRPRGRLPHIPWRLEGGRCDD
jgi:hypothetical protein